MNERDHNAYVVALCAELRDGPYWQAVEDHINESAALCNRRCDLMRRFSLGRAATWMDLAREAEAIADEACNAVAEKIVAAHIKTRRPPYAHPRLLARYPTGNVPDDEIHNWRQLEMAA